MKGNTIGGDETIPGDEGSLLANRYRVVRQLGQGGMGSVWLVEDTQLDNKLFAVKMLPSIFVSNKRAYRQLKDEAIVAMRLVHPNIVQIRAFEENDGNSFLVMDYVDGQTLDDYLAEHTGTTGGIPEAEVLRILTPIAAALDYAHGEGVVHRDVKPANVMIREDGHPFILDFGIAREIQETMTRVTGKLSSGTLPYMSPEQLMGAQPKPAQDVYSFAAMVYECLKGEPPFSHGQIEFQIMNKQPESPPGGTQLVASVMAGLAKKPEDRPATCAAVLRGSGAPAASSRTVNGNGKSAASSNQQQPGGSRSCATAAILSAVALLALGGVIWYRSTQRQELSRRSAIAAQQTAARQQEKEKAKRAEDAARKKADAERRMNEEGRAKEEAEHRRKAEEDRLAAERRAKDLATEKRIEAKVQQGKVARISDADGFKARKDALEDVFVRAEAFYDENAKRWAEAEALYKDYIEQSKDVISLDGERQRAVAKRSEVQASFKKAEGAGAKTYARESWNAAVKTWSTAAAEFGSGEFVTATEKFTNALREFEVCAIVAQNNKRIADETRAGKKQQAGADAADELRRQEELRKAMQSLPGKWTCTTTGKDGSDGKYNISWTAKYELVFDKDGTFTEQQVVGSSETTRTGHWSLVGNALSLRYNENAVTVSCIQSERYVHNYTVPNYQRPYKFIIHWRDDGSFELRHDINDLKAQCPNSDLQYDANGTFEHHTKWRKLIFSGESMRSETAKIFRRVPN